MKLLMKQRVFSWTDTYDVYDEAGNKKYFVKALLVIMIVSILILNIYHIFFSRFKFK